MNPTIVSGAVSTLTDLGRDEAWLQGWLREQPSRLGLGELSVEATPADDGADGGPFMASKDDRCFSVDVQLGELDASRGFGMLDAWARNRVRQPDKDHVAVLVTETCGERYRTTLETLTKHLPLVVIELAVWRGENEALVIPHVALASEGVDLGSAPASAAASALSRVDAAAQVQAEGAKPVIDDAPKPDAKAPQARPEGAASAAKVEGESSQAKTAEAKASEPPANKDDTGVADPWGLPRKEPEAAAAAAAGANGTNGSNGSRLLNKFNS
jgi:hypothetical protein